MPTAERVGNKIVLHTEYRDRDLIKVVPGARYDKDERVWTVPLSWANCLCLKGVFGSRLELGEKLIQWGYDERARRVDPAMSARAVALQPEGDTAGDERLYPYQRTGVSFLAAADDGAILADGMGLGKTIQAITHAVNVAAQRGPILVVCPNSVKHNWAKEFGAWAPHLKVAVVEGGAAKRRKLLADESTDVFIINWEALRIHSRLAPYGSVRLTDKEKEPGELNRHWSVVVADEAHRAKDPKSKQTRALWAIGRTADYRLALTGTPIANHPADFWSLLHFVSPQEWPARTKFIDRYCLTSWNAFGGLDIVGVRPELREEFFKVVDPRFLRRRKDVALPWLPPKVYITREITLPNKQRKAYDALDDGVADIDGEALIASDPLAINTRRQQLASSWLRVSPDGSVQLAEPSGKLDELDALLDELGDDEPVVVFAASRQLIELAAARLAKRRISCAQITGAVAPADRQWAIDAFETGSIRVLLLTLGAGAEGLTLTRSRYLVFLQRSFSLVENLQAEDRIHRPGAEKHEAVFIIDLITKDTVDENARQAVEQKVDMLQQITRDPRPT